jgi:hypothetical protein
MSENIHQRFARLAVMIEDHGGPYNSDDPYRFARHKIKQAAWAALDNGMRTAAEVLEAGEAFNREISASQSTSGVINGS